jgi:putative gypsy type transposon
VRFPPPHCIAVYLPAFELGLRFPLHPFCRELLDLLDVSVLELYQIAWGCIVAFLILCKVLGVSPTLTAFTYIFRARLCNSQEYGCGWITFTHRRELEIVHDLPDNQRNYRTKFAYLYCSQGWNIKTSYDIKPKLSNFNNGIPVCSINDAVIIEYAKMDVKLDRKPSHVQFNWIPSPIELMNEDLLSAFQISLSIDKSKDWLPTFIYLYACIFT